MLQQDRLRTLPQPMPVGPPDLRGPTQLAQEEASKKSADAILAALNDATAKADANPDDAIVSSSWPTNTALQKGLTDWLAAHGVPEAALAPDEFLVGGSWTDVNTLKTDWPMPAHGHVVAVVDLETREVSYFRNNNGQIQPGTPFHD